MPHLAGGRDPLTAPHPTMSLWQVNVFLGLGLPWTMAAIYWKLKGPNEQWLQAYPNINATYHPEGAREGPHDGPRGGAVPMWASLARAARPSRCSHPRPRRCSRSWTGVYVVCAGSLAFSVTVFTAVALVTLAIILGRRVCLSPAQELGGDRRIKYGCAGVLVTLYCVYILFSILRSEDVVDSFADYLAEYTANDDCPR